MSIVKRHEADRYVLAPPRGVFLYLVFGTDAGLISERAHRLVLQAVDDPKDPFQLVRLDADLIAKDPARLLDEVEQIPLFGGRRAVLVDAGSRNIAPAVEKVLALPPASCTVILEAGALKRDAPLRRLVERSRVAAAIECFPDDARDIARLIDQEAREASLEIAEDARQMLVHLLGADRLSTRGELAKLVLYAHGSGRITLEDVETVVADASALALDAAVDGALLGDFDAIETTVARAFAEGTDPGLLVGAALRHALLVHRARLEVEANRSVSEAVEAATRFGFHFKRRGAFEQQVRRWTASKIARAVEILAEASARCRREPQLSEAIAERALWSVALSAPERAK
jgi:DNA polymerase-3 subunit delta